MVTRTVRIHNSEIGKKISIFQNYITIPAVHAFVSRLRDHGLVSHLVNQVVPPFTRGSARYGIRSKEEEDTPDPLTLAMFDGAFLILAVGAMVSFLVLWAEWLRKKDDSQAQERNDGSRDALE